MNSRTSLLIVATLAALTTLAACSKDGSDSGNDGNFDGGSDGLSDADQATADALWAAMSGYSAWNQNASWTGIQPSDDGTHGSHVQIWFNGTAGTSLAGGGDAMADGSILVKEGYSSADGTTVNAITAMQKNGEDWLWARYTATGEATTAGPDAEAMCSGCHMSGKDSIRFVSW